MNVLIADDNDTNRKLLRAILEVEGHHVEEARDGLQALELLKRESVDAIISDILMPRLDGYMLCREVRGSERLWRMPFVMYTATYTSELDEQLASDMGADVYLRKPSSIREILAALDKASTKPRPDEPSPCEAHGDDTVMKEYSEALVRKLEERNVELEQARAVIAEANRDLERRVKSRTAELEAANQELEAFGQSAAHDLRAPLRTISRYCQSIEGDASSTLGQVGITAINRIRASAKKMDLIIGALLQLARVRDHKIMLHSVDLGSQVRSIVKELQDAQPARKVDVKLEPGPIAMGDQHLLRIALENLLSNAWKFTAQSEHPKIEYGHVQKEDEVICYVRDNGAGFDMTYADQLFKPFQRLHSQSDFEGTGLGLTIVNRIVKRLDGRIWAESTPEKGTTFYLSLPASKTA